MNFSPSLMCANQLKLMEEIENLESTSISSFHIDIMDGIFVKNFALSWGQVQAIRKVTTLPLEVHMMVKDLQPHKEFILSSNVDVVFLHFNPKSLTEDIAFLKNNGIVPGIVVDKDVSLNDFEHLKKLSTYFLYMRVKPGFAGQKPLPGCDTKLKQLLTGNPEVKIAVDGAVSKEFIKIFSIYPNCNYVLGTSALFNRDKNYREILNELSA